MEVKDAATTFTTSSLSQTSTPTPYSTPETATRRASLPPLNPTFDLPDDQVRDIKKMAAFITGLTPTNVNVVAFHALPESHPLISQSNGLRRSSFFAHTLLSNKSLIVSDTLLDERFSGNSAVTANPPVRFFAGVPLISSQGKRYGVLSLTAPEPHSLSDDQVDSLNALGRQLTHSLESSQAAATLRKREEQQTAVSQLGVTALSGLPLTMLFSQATSLICEVLDVDYCGILERVPDSHHQRLIAGHGWKPGTVGIATLPVNDSYINLVIDGEQPIVVGDFRAERRFSTPSLFREHNIISGAGVVISGQHGPWGALLATARHRREFSYDDVVLLQLIANTLSNAVLRNDTEQQVRHQALHDALTGLPNRALLLDRLQQHFARARRTGAEIAALFIDLDDFKPVNDTLGHEAGDELLIAFSERLRTLIRPTDTVSRLAGDEFVVVIEEPEGRNVGQVIAERIAASLAEPFRLRSGTVTVSASIGLALGSTAGDPETLLRNADAAMYQAKRSGVGRCAIFDETLHTRRLQHLQLKQALRGAIERDEMSVVYQPVVDVTSGEIRSVEALLRWHHPELGDVAPTEFIPLAEDSGMIVPIGRWVLQQACQAAGRWNTDRQRPLIVHVNLSPRQLGDPDLVSFTSSALAAAGARPEHLGFEITESALLNDADAAIEILHELKALGVHLSMDDFGTGYSSLGYLKCIPLDLVKIDQSFVHNLGVNTGDSAIVAAVVSMTEALGLVVTAEGVESSDQLAQLRKLGCQLAQGFYFTEPVTPQEIDHLRQHNEGFPA